MEGPSTSIDTWPSYHKGSHTVIVASDATKRAQGLQGERIFPLHSILLFPGTAPGTYFHTNNCHMPIDIIALNTLNIVLRVWTALPGVAKIGPMPPGTAKVAEVPAGWCSKRNIRMGSVMPV
jgi:uncharacterized membrane protein (UPF0127 family)